MLVGMRFILGVVSGSELEDVSTISGRGLKLIIIGLRLTVLTV